jgi:RNA recognition motif-containing protein
MIHGLHPHVTENTLYCLFSKYGFILDIRIVTDYATKLPSERLRRHSCGYGYVDFTTPQAAARAKESSQELRQECLHGYLFENKWLSIKLKSYKE